MLCFVVSFLVAKGLAMPAELYRLVSMANVVQRCVQHT